MKRFLLILISATLILGFCACNSNDSNEDLSSKYPELFEESSTSQGGQEALGKGKLIVNGEELSESLDVYQTHAIVPLMPILGALGYEIEWTSTTGATLKYNETVYFLDLSSKSVIQEGESKNLLPNKTQDSSYVCESVEYDIMIDEVTLYSLLNEMATPVKVVLNYESLTVTVTQK